MNNVLRKSAHTSNICNLRPIPRAKPFSNLIVHLWNANSLRNKTVTLSDHVLSYDVDIMIVVETWLSDDDMVIIGECTPPGYEFLSFPRGSAHYGGGIGILYKKSLNLSSTPSGFASVSFEHCVITIKKTQSNSSEYTVLHHREQTG